MASPPVMFRDVAQAATDQLEQALGPEAARRLAARFPQVAHSFLRPHLVDVSVF